MNRIRSEEDFLNWKMLLIFQHRDVPKAHINEDNYINLFDSDWNELIELIELCKERQVFGSQNLIDSIDNALTCDCKIINVYNAVVKFIKYYNSVERV